MFGNKRADIIAPAKELVASLTKSRIVVHNGRARWSMQIWENFGWHYCAISPCGRWKVHANQWRKGSPTYSAFLSEKGSPSGIWVKQGKTPEQAIKRTRKAARESVLFYMGLLDIEEAK